jgi:beta-xylosidase
MQLGLRLPTVPKVRSKDAIGGPLVGDAFERKSMGFASDGDIPYTIDPTMFVDDDGQAYLHYGGFSCLVNAKLGDDMISISGTMRESTPSCYFESPYLIKRNGTYYEIYARGANAPTIDYATSSGSLGRKGTVLP